MSDATVSVLIPTFNRELYIEECLNSILAQTYKDLVIIVYDDGSKDKTVDTIKGMGIDPKKLKLIAGDHVGVAAARNILIAAASTEYVCWQDSDDVSNPYRVELQMKLAKSSSSPNVMTLCQWMHRVKKEDRLEKPEEVKSFRPGCATALFKREEAPLFNEGIKMGGEDRAWRTRFELLAKINPFPYVPMVLYYVRRHSQRIGVLKKSASYTEQVAMSNEHRHQEYLSIYAEFGIKIRGKK